MRAIDLIAEVLSETLARRPAFAGVAPLVATFAAAARTKCETLHTDAEIFNVWASFVAAAEELVAFSPEDEGLDAELGLRLMLHAKDVIVSITRARVPMPKTTQAFLDACEAYRAGQGLRSPAQMV